MTESSGELGPRVVVAFTKSSSKDGSEGYTIRLAEGVTPDEADRVFDIAVRIRLRAIGALAGPTLEEQLEASLAPVKEVPS